MQVQWRLTVFVIFFCVVHASQIEKIKEKNEKTKDGKVIQIYSTAERTKIWVKDGKTYKSANFPKFIQRLQTGGQKAMCKTLKRFNVSWLHK